MFVQHEAKTLYFNVIFIQPNCFTRQLSYT